MYERELIREREAAATRIETIRVCRESFAVGAVGRAMITDELEGRIRPKAVFERQLRNLMVPSTTKHSPLYSDYDAGRVASHFGIFTVIDFLHFDPRSIPESKKAFYEVISRPLGRLFRFLEIGPEGELVKRILKQPFYAPVYAISPQAEEARKKVFSELMSQLPDEYTRYFRLYFGFDDWVVRSYDEAERLSGVTRKRAREITQSVFDFFRANKEALACFLPFELESREREAGLTCPWDLAGS
jgi:hypothetical protein